MNIKKIFAGILFLSIAALTFYSASVIYAPIPVSDQSDFASLTHAVRVYENEQALESEEKNQAEPQVETQSSSPKEIKLEPYSEVVNAEAKPLRLEALVKEAQNNYAPEVAQEKEGQMWIDRASSQYLVTLGALHGLHPQQRLSVYYNDQPVGHVAVETALDVISYVKPLSGTNLSEDNYYTVVVDQ